MRTQKISTAATRRVKRPDGRLLRDMRKRHHGGRRGGKSVLAVGVLILARVVALGWYWLR
jgi:hypothetical protein